MHAMIMDRVVDLEHDHQPLKRVEMPEPVPGPDEVLIEVTVCGVCHTELDEIEGRTPPPRYPMIPGHQVVGRVIGAGAEADRHRIGTRVGVAWIFSACGRCEYCRQGLENLCADFRATGRDAHGGYAELMVVPEDSAYRIPDRYSDAEAAPLLCAGAIGYRALKLAELPEGGALGLTGFGASGHLVLKLIRHRDPTARVYVFARSESEQRFARELGAVWSGDTRDEPPEKLHAIIDTTPVWLPVINALEMLKPGGRLVINAIRKESHDQHQLLELDYPTHLWAEKEIKSVANVTRQDVREFLKEAAEVPIIPEFQEFPLAQANKALLELKQRKIRGAKVLRVSR